MRRWARLGLVALSLAAPCHQPQILLVQQPADQRAAEDHEADADQPGLDDQHGADRAVGDGAGGDQRREDQPGEDPQADSPTPVATAPGSRARQRIRPPSSSRCDHQKNSTVLSDGDAHPASRAAAEVGGARRGSR